MKILTSLFVVLFTAAGYSQLTVKPGTGSTENNFIYVKDEVLYVEDDIKLEVNHDPNISNIYLRFEGQLIQGPKVASQNEGDGTLSVFQEGTTDAYHYNNWGSPVGEVMNGAVIGNTDFGIPLLYTPTSTLLSTQINAIGGYNGQSGNPVSIAKYWIYKYTGDNDNSGEDNYYDWQQVLDAIDIESGLGFTMKGVNGTDATEVDGRANNPEKAQRYDFRGRPNDGEIELNVAPNEKVLVGNPYPSALDLSYFLLENSTTESSGNSLTTLNCTSDASVTRQNSITGIAYFWDSDPSVQSHYLVDYVAGYGAFAPVDCGTTGILVAAAFYMYNEDGEAIGSQEGVGQEYARRYSPIAQGFMVEGADETGSLPNLKFSNRHRVFVQENESTSQFHRYANLDDVQNEAFDTPGSTDMELQVIPKLRLNIIFDNQYTRQIALGFWDTATQGVDAAMDAKNTDGLANDAGFLHNDKNYLIDVRQFDVTEEIPLFLKLNAQKNLKFKINNFENFDTNNVYIFDKATQIYHPVKDQTFSITLPPGTYHDRFRLTFLNEEEQESLTTPEEVKYDFDIFQNNNLAQLEIKNPENVEIKQVAMYDITGKQIFAKRNLSTKSVYKFPTNNIQEAVYIVRITTVDNKETAKKISVKN